MLECAFIGIADLGRSVYSLPLVRWMLKADLDTRAAAATTDAAVSEQDGVVTFEPVTDAMINGRLRPSVANP